MPAFVEALVAAAEAELTRFAGRRETAPSVAPILTEYWLAVPDVSAAAARVHIARRTAWSAAFISFLVRQALAESGTAAHFEFSASHSIYAGAAIRNDFDAVPPPAFYGLPPNGAGGEKLRPGDILGYPRTTAIDDYEDALRAARRQPRPDTYPSHFDVVTGISDGEATLIGGNVSQTVKRTTLKLDPDGFAPVRGFRSDMTGAIISGPFICIIRLMT